MRRSTQRSRQGYGAVIALSANRGGVKDELGIRLQRHIEDRCPESGRVGFRSPFDPVGVTNGAVKKCAKIFVRSHELQICRRRSVPV